MSSVCRQCSYLQTKLVNWFFIRFCECWRCRGVAFSFLFFTTQNYYKISKTPWNLVTKYNTLDHDQFLCHRPKKNSGFWKYISMFLVCQLSVNLSRAQTYHRILITFGTVTYVVHNKGCLSFFSITQNYLKKKQTF